MTEQEARAICKEIYEKKVLYIILSEKQAQMLGGVSIPFIGQPDGKTIIYIFDEYESAKHFVDELHFEKLENNYPIAEINKESEVYSLSSIISIAMALGVESMDYNALTNDAFGVNLRWFCDVNNVNPQKISMMLTSEQMEKIQSNGDGIKVAFSPMKIINFIDPYDIDAAVKEKDLRFIFDAGETIGDYKNTYSSLSMIECLLLLDHVTTKYIPAAKAQNRIADVEYFKQVEPILQEVVMNKLVDEANLFTAVDSNNKVIVNNNSVYVLITDLYKYSGHHIYQKLEGVASIKKLIRENNPQRIIVTDGPRYMGIIPVDKFLTKFI